MSNCPSFTWYAEWHLEALAREQSLDQSDVAAYVESRNTINAERVEMNKRLAAEMARGTCEIVITLGEHTYTVGGQQVKESQWLMTADDYAKVQFTGMTEVFTPVTDATYHGTNLHGMYKTNLRGCTDYLFIFTQLCKAKVEFELTKYTAYKNGQAAAHLRVWI